MTSAVVIALAIAAGCRSSERQAAEAARNSSQVAVSPEQQQLWQEAAKEGATPGLERVPVPQEPVRSRDRRSLRQSRYRRRPSRSRRAS